MIISATVILTFFFLTWSIFLRHIAIYLIKEFRSKSATIPSISSVDIVATIWWLFAAYKITNFLPAYFLFLSALWITIHTDMAQMLISRFVSFYLIPVGILFSAFNFLPITACESFLAAFLSYGLFWIANKIFYFFKKHDGLGQGDLELIAMIGSFTGLLGSWFTILCASTLGTICGCLYLIYARKKVKILPFGPFLAAGAFAFVLFQDSIINFLITV